MKKQTLYFVYIFLVPIGRQHWQSHNWIPASNWYRSIHLGIFHVENLHFLIKWSINQEGSPLKNGGFLKERLPYPISDLILLPVRATDVFVLREFQTWAWQSLFELKKENSRARTSTMCGTICSLMEDQCNVFAWDAENLKCSLGTVRSSILIIFKALM